MLNNLDLLSFNFTITKMSVDPATGERRIRMSASDTSADVFDEKMSLELFNNFVSRIQNKDIPMPFKSLLREKSGWDGGLPYASVSHYKSGVEGKNIPADITSVYLDGKVLKSVAVVRNTPMGDALWKSLLEDKAGTSKYKDKIRVSIGFLDLKHSHGNFVFERDGLAKVCPMCNNSVGNKIYLDGVLVHEAFTRKPANPRTDVEVMRMSDEINTREEDASSIVGEKLATELEVNKSALEKDEVTLVVKAAPVMDSPEEDAAEHPADCTCKACAGKKKMSATKTEIVEVVPVEKSELELAFDALVAGIEQNKSLVKEDALRAIQPMFDNLGAAVQKSFPDPVAPTIVKVGVSEEQIAAMLGEFKSLFGELKTSIQSVSDEVAILKSQTAVKQIAPTQVPAPRTMQVERSQAIPQQLIQSAQAVQGKGLTIRELVNKTTQVA